MGSLTQTGGGRVITFAACVLLAVLPVVFHPWLYDDFTLPKQATLIVVALGVLFPALLLSGQMLPRNALLRAAVIALAAWLVVVQVLGEDPRGGLLGVYQYRQGFITWACYLVVFLAGMFVAKRGMRIETLALAAGMGLAVVTGYSAVQGMGADPFTWWQDTERSISTIGNANELAAYAIVSLAFAGAVPMRNARAGTVVTFVTCLAVAFIIVQTQSRTGLGALGVFVVAGPVAGRIAGLATRTSMRAAGVVVAGMVAGGLLSAFIGNAPDHTADRFRSGLEGGDTSYETRLSLAQGTLATIRDNPIFGAGPDGLFLAFPKSRPANLEGEFETYDLLVQSSHNWPLDVAAKIGLPGLALLILVLGTVAIRSTRQERKKPSPSIAMVWAGLAAYFAILAFNPISLAAHTVAWLLLGWLAGRSEAALSTKAVIVSGRSARAVAAVACAGSAAGLAGLMVMADLKADDAWGAFARSDPATAATLYADAHDLLPIVRDYDARAAGSWLVAGMNRDEAMLTNAVARYVAFDQRYGYSYDEVLALATATFALGAPPEEVDALVDSAAAYNPNGVRTVDYAANVKQAARLGGALHYQPELNWVYIEAAAPAASAAD